VRKRGEGWWTNPPNPYKADPAHFARLYREKGLSAQQIAQLLGIAKSTALTRLHAFGIHSDCTSRRVTNPDNYRAPVPPYGYRVQDGKLVVDRSEIRACRLVVNLIGEKKLSANATAKELERRGIKNRNGLVKWGHYSVRRIFDRWNGKL